MFVTNISNKKGKAVANQFIIVDGNTTYFQSYKTIVVRSRGNCIDLDVNAWNYSRTTARHRNAFLGSTTKDIKEKIKNGSFKLVDLNAGKAVTKYVS